MGAGRAAGLLVLVLAACGVSGVQLKDEPTDSGMALDWAFSSATKAEEDAAVDAPLEVANSDSGAMKESGMVDNDMQDEDEGQAMSAFHEDLVESAGSGEEMKLSGPSVPVVSVGEPADADDDDVGVSAEDMAPTAALTNVLDAKEAAIADQRNQLVQTKNLAEEKTKEAQQMINEAYTKNQQLRQMQDQILQETAALEAQRAAVKQREEQVELLKAELERRLAAVPAVPAAQANVQVATKERAVKDEGTSAAIQTRLEALEKREKQFEEEATRKEAALHDSKASLEQLKSKLDSKDSELSKKEEDVKRLYVELNTLNKSSRRHEAHIKEQEKEIKTEKESLAAREARLDAKQKELNALHAKSKDELLSASNALQTTVQVGVSKPLSELPEELQANVVGPVDDTNISDNFAAQPAVQVQLPKPKLVVPPTPKSSIEIVDRSARDIETTMDQRPPTYGNKFLTGQRYSATYEPKADARDASDPDGKCRNSRGEEVPCVEYQVPHPPPIVPSVASILEGDYDDAVPDLDGPCVLRCLYHKGPKAAAGPNNVETVSMEIPTGTGLNNTLLACPKTNNGFPFLSCSLMLDNSPRCRTTCVFDGDANPLKPKKLGFGKAVGSGDGQFAFDPAEFKTLAHTTYSVVTDVGCKASMKADPLVACEVKL